MRSLHFGMGKQASSSSSPWQTEQNSTCTSRIRKLWQSRWLVLAASLWLQTCAGVGYAFGGYSPLIKSTLGYSQQQITILGIAKDLGANIGLIAGSLSGVLPTWSLIAIGIVHNLVGYGWLWLIVTGQSPILPMWAVCILILIGTNGETYYNTVLLVTNVSNFPNSRGHVSGLLKGFTGLCSAIFSQIYITFFAPDQAAYLLIIALGPTIVSLLTMFIIRRIKSKEEGKLSDTIGFSFIYGDSLIMAAYLMGVLILQDVMTVSFSVRLMITILLLVMVGLPLATPMVLWVAEKASRGEKKAVKEVIAADAEQGTIMDMEEPLMGGYEGQEQDMHEEEKGLKSHDLYEEGQGGMGFTSKDVYEKGPGEMCFTSKDVYQEEMGITSSNVCEKGEGEMGFTSHDLGRMALAGVSRAASFTGSVAMSELEDEKPEGLDNVPEKEREEKIREIRRRIILAAAEGAVTVKKKEKGPQRREDFTLGQALVKLDFWLLFCAQVCGAGTGMAAIDNMGQISQSQGYSNSSVFVSMTSIFNFLGRLLGGYFSEIFVRRYVLPRSWAICMAQGIMGVGHFLIAMGWPNTLYVGTLMVGTSYGAHWGIVPAMVSELFGIKDFGMFYNFYTMATPVGVLFFSGFLAGYIYDIEAAKQISLDVPPLLVISTSTSCSGAICFRLSFLLMMGFCFVGILLAAILSIRTRIVYMSLYTTKFAPPSSKC